MTVAGVTIAEQPILVDLDGEAQAWLDRFMPEASVFRTPKVDLDQYLSGPDGNCNGAFFRSSLPDLPPIKIGQIQWPCVGASRYARGLFLVDRVALFEILEAAWGQAIPGTFPYAIPTDWTQTKNRPVSVFLANTASDGTAIDFSIWLYVLMPIRISDDLWVLPLVDGRYFRLTDCKPNAEINALKPDKTWQDLFNGFSSGVNYKIYVDYADDAEEEMGHPDTVFANPQIPTPFAVDTACFSIGRRPVVLYPTDAEVDYDFPEDSQLGVVAQKSADAAMIKTATLTNPKIIGGTSGESRRPRSVNVSTRYCPQFYSGTNLSTSYKKNLSLFDRNGCDLFCKAVWNTTHDEDSVTSFEAYVDAIAGILNEWNVEEHYVSFPDLIEVTPGGFDDYIIYESSGDKKTTTVRSLPIDFVTPFLLGQAPSGASFDSLSVQTRWFRTQNQIVSAKVSADINGQLNIGGVRQAVFGVAQIIDGALYDGTNYFKASVNILNGQRQNFKTGDLIYLKWVDDVAGGTPSQGWVICDAPCSERLEQFQMLTDWDAGTAIAQFQLIDELAPYGVGIVEDPQGIFFDQLSMGKYGLSTWTCRGRHFVIQAKCNQTFTVPTLGCCVYGSPGSPSTAQTTEAFCELLDGSWTAGPCE